MQVYHCPPSIVLSEQTLFAETGGIDGCWQTDPGFCSNTEPPVIRLINILYTHTALGTGALLGCTDH